MILTVECYADIHEVFNSGNTARFEALKNDIFNPDGLSGGPTMNVLATSSVLPPMGTFVNSYTSSSTATSSCEFRLSPVSSED